MKKISILLVAVFMFALIAVPGVANTQKEWTIGVFLNGDNNLEQAAYDDVNEMEKIGSNENLNLVVQLDRAKGYYSGDGDWTNTKIFYIEKDNSTSTFTSKVVKELPEVDMGDYKELVKFAKFLKANYPAKKYMIIVWNHGAGWKFTGDKEIVKGISYDDSSNNHMTVPDLKKAMEQINGVLGQKLDVFGMDACLMQMVEVSYEYKNLVRYVCASEETEPGDGWPYDDYLKVVKSNPTISAKELAVTIAKKFVASYSGGSQGSSSGSTQSAIELSKLDAVAGAMDEFGKAIVDNIDEIKDTVNSAIRAADAYYYSDYKDAYHFAKLMSASSNKVVNEKAKAAMKAIDNCVLWYGAATGGYYAKHQDCHGLALYIPKKYQYRPAYEDLAFAKDTNWDEALKATFAVAAKASDVKEVVEAVKADEASPEFLATVLTVKAKIDDEDSFNTFVDELRDSRNFNLVKTANIVKENLTNKTVNESLDNSKYVGKIVNLIK